MLQPSHSLRQLALAAVMIAAATCAAQMNSFAQLGKAVVQDASDNIFRFKAPFPLGAEALVLRPLNRKFYILACLEDRRFDQLQVSRVRQSQYVLDAEGHVWQNYPDELSFRVTATAMADMLSNLDSSEITEPADMNSFLLGIKFRLKDYRDLEMKVLPPSSIKLIGLPADLPGDERVYRVSFNTAQIPVRDRLVLEILSPSGQLLTRFHLELL